MIQFKANSCNLNLIVRTSGPMRFAKRHSRIDLRLYRVWSLRQLIPAIELDHIPAKSNRPIVDPTKQVRRRIASFYTVRFEVGYGFPAVRDHVPTLNLLNQIFIGFIILSIIN